MIWRPSQPASRAAFSAFWSAMAWVLPYPQKVPRTTWWRESPHPLGYEPMSPSMGVDRKHPIPSSVTLMPRERYANPNIR